MREKIFVLFIMLLFSSSVFADRVLNNLIKQREYQEAFQYIEKNYPPKDRNIDLWIKAGRLSEDLGKSEKAIRCYLAVVGKDPGNEEALRSLVILFNQKKNYDNVYILIKKLLKIKKDDHEILWKAAKVCINLKKYKEAEKYLFKIKKFNIEAQKELGYIYYISQRYDKAIPILKAYFYRKRDLEVAKKIVSYYKNKKDIFSAIEHFEYVADNDKGDIVSGLCLARYWVKEFEITMAMKYYEEVPEENYDLFDYYNIGNYKKAEGKFNDAVKFFSVIIEKGIKNSDLYKKTQIELGLVYIEQREYKKAINYLSPVKDSVSDYNLHMARIYDALKNYNKSKIFASNYLEENPTSIQARLILATSLEKKGYRTKAKKIRESIMIGDTNNIDIHYEMGSYYYGSGQFSNAIIHFEKSYLINQNIICMEKIAFCAYKINKLDKSVDASILVLEVDPDNKTVLNIIYKIYIKKDRYKDALPYLIKLTQLESNNLDYFLNLSICYEKLDDYTNIISVDEKIVKLSPDNVKSRRRLAEYSFDKKRYSEALNMYDDLIDLDKINSTDYPNIIKASLNLNFKEKAVKYLEQYSKFKPTDASIYKRIGELSYDLKKYDKSLNNYRKALSLDPDMRGFYKNYAKLVSIEECEISTIIAVSHKAILLKETDFEIYENLGDAYVKIENYQKALHYYQEAMKLNPQNISVFSKLAKCQIKTKNIDNAIISYEQLIETDNNFINYKILGDLYAKKGDKNKAVKNYEIFLKENNNDSVTAYLAIYEYDEGHYVNAIKYFDRIINFTKEAIYKKGQLYIRLERYKDCIPIFTEYINKYPDADNFYYANKMLGIAYDKLENAKAVYYYKIYLDSNKDRDIAYRTAQLTEKKNNIEALDIYESNSLKYPDDYRNFIKIGSLSEDNKRAIESFERAIEINDTSLSAWLGLGKLYDNMGDEENKINAYKKAVIICPHNFYANKYLGIGLQKIGNNKKDILYLELARSLNPKDAEVMYALAKCYVRERRIGGATFLFETAKKLNPDDCKIRYELINHFINQQMYEKALKESEELINKSSVYKYFDQHLSILFKINKYSLIEELIVERRKKDPENIDLLINLAKAQYLDNRYKDALQSYIVASFIKEDYEPVIIGRATVYIKMGKLDNARTCYEKVLEENPKSIESILGLAHIYEIYEDDSISTEYFKKAQEINPDHPTVIKWIENIK